LSVKPELLSTINRRKLRYLGHINRNTKTNLMTTVLQGKIEAKRNRGRPPISYMTNITETSGLSLSEVVHMSRNRQQWRETVNGLGAATIDLGDADRWQEVIILNLYIHPYETVHHVLFDCQAMKEARKDLLPPVPSINNTLYGSAKQLQKTSYFIKKFLPLPPSAVWTTREVSTHFPLKLLSIYPPPSTPPSTSPPHTNRQKA